MEPKNKNFQHESQDLHQNSIILDIFGNSEPSLFVSQSGSENSIEISILGSDVLVDVIQSGAANEATTFISGEENVLIISQKGLGNHAGTRQVGYRNTLTIHQDGF